MFDSWDITSAIKLIVILCFHPSNTLASTALAARTLNLVQLSQPMRHSNSVVDTCIIASFMSTSRSWFWLMISRSCLSCSTWSLTVLTQIIIRTWQSKSNILMPWLFSSFFSTGAGFWLHSTCNCSFNRYRDHFAETQSQVKLIYLEKVASSPIEVSNLCRIKCSRFLASSKRCRTRYHFSYCTHGDRSTDSI